MSEPLAIAGATADFARHLRHGIMTWPAARIVTLSLILLTLTGPNAFPASRPNILLIYTDDMD